MSKKGRVDYGEEVLIDTSYISVDELKVECGNYYEVHILNGKIVGIEMNTRGQAANDFWHEEKKKQLKSSIFGEIISSFNNNNSPNIVKDCCIQNSKETF